MTTKEKVLNELNNKSEPVSGEYLAKICGVSRAAVWKAINSLREAGVCINGTANGGYRIEGQADIFSIETVRREFETAFPQFSESRIECFNEIDSTNTYAKRLLSQCASLRNEKGELTADGKKYNNSIIVAESQTAGRGRSGRTFVSPKKTGIYLSVIVMPEGGVKNPARITAFSAVAVCRAIEKLYGAEPSIKWINDIFLNGKKVSGILTEGTANFETGIIDSAIIGIGINIEPNEEFSKSGLSKVAGSIVDGTADKNDKKNSVTRAKFAAFVAGEVLSVLQEDTTAVISEYKARSFIIGKTVEVHALADSDQGMYKATAVDITDDAALVVECSDGSRHTLSSGEVTLKSDAFV